MQAQSGSNLPKLIALMQRLLAPDGCPWDREQTLESLRAYVIEEAHEVAEAIDQKDIGHLREELGDLLFQVVFQTAITAREQHFGIDDVIDGIHDKMVRRHAWVFGTDAKAESATDALAKWEAQKAKEKQRRGALSGVPTALPALLRALRVGEKAATSGYDFVDVPAVREKLAEEMAELDEALQGGDTARIEEEIGDVLFTVANLSRKASVDPESALRRALQRFSDRFRFAELECAKDGKALKELDDAQRDELWQQAKQAEKVSP